MAPRGAPESLPASDLQVLEKLAPKTIRSKDGKRHFNSQEVMGHIGRFAKANDLHAAVELICTIGLWLYMFRLSWWWLPIHGLVTMRVFIVGTHDTAHGSLWSSRTWNTVTAVLCGPLTFMPGLWWQYGHDYHHEHSNDLDYDQASQTAPNTVLEYFAWPAYYRSLYRYFTRPWVMMTQTSIISMLILQMLKATTVIEWTVQLTYFGIAAYTGNLARYVAAMGCVAPFGVFLFHLQHTYEDAVREHGRDYFENGYYGSTYLQAPWWLRPFTAAIEVHHIHHLNAKVPSYRLYECHNSAPAGMWDGVREMTMSEGWRSLKYALWDHALQRLISVEELDHAVAKHGEEGYKRIQQAAMDKQVKAREALTAAREAVEASKKAQRLQQAKAAKAT